MPSDSGGDKSQIGEWEVILGFLLSGVIHSILITYPFMLERKSELGYFIAQTVISVSVTGVIILVELAIGQLNQCGILQSWGEIVPVLRGIGFASTLVSVCSLGFLGFTLSISLFYLANSVCSPVPWANNSSYVSNITLVNTTATTAANLYYRNVAFVTALNPTEEAIVPLFHLWICMIIFWIILFGLEILSQKYNWIQQGSYILLFIGSYIMIPILLGVTIYFGPRFTFPEWEIHTASVLLEPSFWSACAIQQFMYYPLGVGTAVRTVGIISVVGIIAEKIIGLFYYTVTTELATQLGAPPESLQTNGPAILFRTIPDLLGNLDSGSHTTTLLYFTFLTISIGGSILMLFKGLVNTASSTFPDIPKWVITILVTALGFLFGVPLLTSSYALGFVRAIIVLLELVGVCIYGLKNFKKDIEFMTRTKMFVWFNLLRLFITGIALVGIFVEFYLSTQLFYFNGQVIPQWAIASGCIMFGMTFLFLISPGICEAIKIFKDAPDLTTINNIKSAFKSKESVGPKIESDRMRWIEKTREQYNQPPDSSS